MSDELFDVIAVDISANTVRLMATDKTKENAEAIVKMAVMRRGGCDEFFVEVPAGKYKGGECYK